jgi:hypothetical protein
LLFGFAGKPQSEAEKAIGTLLTVIREIETS